MIPLFIKQKPLCEYGYRKALNCRWGCYFVLIQSNQRSSQQRGFFTHKAFALQINQNHGLQYFYPTSFALFLRFSKNLLCPCNHTGYHVLLDFVRSLSADGKRKFLKRPVGLSLSKTRG